jgi:uncharacterized protein
VTEVNPAVSLRPLCYVRRILAQHLLFLFLAIVAPLWDYYDTGRLKKHPGSAQKIRYYKTTAAWLWIASAVAVLIVGWERVFTITPAPYDAAWLFGHLWVRYLVGTLIALFVALSLQPFVTVALKKLRKKPRTYRTAETVKSLDYFLPATSTERRWWAFIAITAGVCEETLYRGFLVHYLHASAFSLNLTVALLISSGLFGLVHLYGGVSGVVGSFVFGFLMGMLFLLTGNLLLPMIVHALLDLRMLVILRPPGEQAAGIEAAGN